MARPFSAFNARSLTFEKVATTFVPPDSFYELLGLTHTVVIGPRGSGKTTLLKMLTREAMDHWPTDRQPERYEPSMVEFNGVFIPTDVAWNTQLESLGMGGIDPELADALGRSAFTTHILRSLVRAFSYELESGQRVPRLTVSDQHDLARALAGAWNLDVALPSLAGVTAALESRFADIQALARRLALRGEDASSLQGEEYLHYAFGDLVPPALTIAGDLSGWDEATRWALCFDELELAPKSIRQHLLTSLRSSDERLLFKLSFSPYGEDISLLEDALSAMEDHDYNVVDLSQSRQDDAPVRFSQDLFEDVVGRVGLQGRAENLLGVSPLSEHDAYAGKTDLYHAIRELASGDRTFREWVERLDIDLQGIFFGDVSAPPNLRKARQVIPIRYAYRFMGHSKRLRTRRSRKSPDIEIFRGAKAFFLFLEGNPRLIISVTNRIVQGVEDGTQPFNHERVLNGIEHGIASFRAMLRTIPTKADTNGDVGPRGLLSMLDTIGEYFHERLALRDFDPEPPSTIVVDSTASEGLLDAIGKAVNAGALIYVPDDDDQALLASLRGKRFRLTYLLSPYYGLPIKVGPKISMMRVLRGDSEDDSGQLELTHE